MFCVLHIHKIISILLYPIVSVVCVASVASAVGVVNVASVVCVVRHLDVRDGRVEGAAPVDEAASPHHQAVVMETHKRLHYGRTQLL